MLKRYKKNYVKIAMGLLSFIPSEKDLQKLQITINEYETEHDHQLFLWKEDEGFIGLMGVLVDHNQIQIQHISVNPSHREQGFGKLMIMALKERYPNTPLIPNKNTASYFNKCDFNNSLKNCGENNYSLSNLLTF